MKENEVYVNEVICHIDYNMEQKYSGNISLDKVVEKLKADADLKVELRGYCDFPGSNDYNLKLSERRINAVKDALVKAGIEESRITTTPQGKLPNPPKAEQKNRRCDFFFSK